MKLAVYSKPIWRIPNLKEFLPEYDLVYKHKADAIAGWGLKKPSEKARHNASRENVPYISLEDGFLRSYDLGVNNAAPLSLVVDKLGIYYNAAKPSQLEEMIKNARDVTRARNVIAEIKRHRLSKYNCYSENWQKPDGKLVLVIDQCHGDASIRFGAANEESFVRMLAAAKAENPDCKIVVKMHPDVVCGKRKAYIDLATAGDVITITENINPHILFENVEKVYTVTSMMGFEALMHGLPVRCFGMPFYAGWGVTQDEFACERRSAASFEQIFAAAYFDYTRYVNPYTGRKCKVEEIVEIISRVKDYYAAHQQSYSCVGFSRWKRHFVRPYIKSPFNKVEFFRSEEKAISNVKENGGAIVVWAAREKPNLVDEARNLLIYRMEDGFIRSRGLGSDFIAANSLSFDRRGIYFDCRSESDFEHLLNNADFSREDLAHAANLKKLILQTAISKYNIEDKQFNLQITKDKKTILAIGQVENDASIKRGSPEVTTNQQLIDKIRENNPQAFIIYKPHPEIIRGNRRGKKRVEGADVIVINYGIHSLIEKVNEVHTITSLAGFEALLLGKKVVTYGMPFYAGWGLTEDNLDNSYSSRRRKNITLDELIVAALVKYPCYYDFDANLPSTPEMTIAKISQTRPVNGNFPRIQRVLNFISAVAKS